MKNKKEEIETKRNSKEYFLTAGASQLDTLVAKEEVEVKQNEVSLIEVESIEIPRYTLVTSCPYNRHALGAVFSVMEEVPKKLEKERSVNKVAFLPWKEGKVKKGDVLGVIHKKRALL